MKKVTKPVKKQAPTIPFSELPEFPDTPENRKTAYALLYTGKSSQFWQFLCKQLDAVIANTERKILDDSTLTFEEREKLRMERYYQKELRNMPDVLMVQLDPELNKREDENLDPYQ